MARYRRVETRVWTDKRVRNLSKPPPCGQFLWMRLLTGPETTIIPGVIVTGRAGLAEKLGWHLAGFNAALAELVDAGLVRESLVDGLVWVPNAIRHNPPQNPNVVIAWGKEWPEVPECDLKARIYFEISLALKGFSEGFGKAFAKAFGNPSAKEMESFAESGSRSSIQEQEELSSELASEPTKNAPSHIPEFEMTPAEDLGRTEGLQWLEGQHRLRRHHEPTPPLRSEDTTAVAKAPQDGTSQASVAVAVVESEAPRYIDDAYEAASYLIQAIQSHKPDFYAPRPNEWANAYEARIRKKLTGWTKHLDLLIRLDGKSLDEVKHVIDFCHRSEDTFERANILSGAKLRKRWDQLSIKASPSNQRRPGVQRGTPQLSTEKVRKMSDWMNS